MKCFTRPGDEILAEEQSHVLNFEAGAIGLISGVSARPLRAVRGVLDPEAVAAAVREPDIHAPRTSLLCIENTHNLAGGVVTPVAVLQRLRAAASAKRIPVLLDGARLWNAAVAEGVAAAQFAACADLAWFALSKGLCAPVGSVLCGARDAIEECRRIRKQLGGGMRQAGVLAAAGLVALDGGRERLVEDHARARRLAEAFAGMRGLAVDVAATRTNILMVDCGGAPRAARIRDELAARGVLAIVLGGRIRFVTHRDVGDADVERAIAAMPEAAAAAAA